MKEMTQNDHLKLIKLRITYRSKEKNINKWLKLKLIFLCLFCALYKFPTYNSLEQREVRDFVLYALSTFNAWNRRPPEIVDVYQHQDVCIAVFLFINNASPIENLCELFTNLYDVYELINFG